jgi:hypothetical protein
VTDDEDERGGAPTRAFSLAELAAAAQPREVTSATFSYVDAMLTGRLSDEEFDRVQREILGKSAEAPASPTREIERKLESGDLAGAFADIEAMLAEDPSCATALELRTRCRSELAELYQQHLGAGRDRIRLAVAKTALDALGLDRWGAYLVSRLEHANTIDELIDVAAFDRLDTLRVLYDLVQKGVLWIEAVKPPTAPPPSVPVARVRLNRRAK